MRKIGSADYEDNLGKPTNLVEELEMEVFFSKKMLLALRERAEDLREQEHSRRSVEEILDSTPEVWAERRRLRDLRTALSALYAKLEG